MLATTERMVIIDEAELLASMITQSEVMENYYFCLDKLNKSKESQRKISAFSNLKEKYEEVQRFGKYHPDYKNVMSSVREAKREMDLDENVSQFKKAENDLQALLDEISMLIGRAVSENIKVPTGNPYFDNLSSCGGGCGSGGACRCSV